MNYGYDIKITSISLKHENISYCIVLFKLQKGYYVLHPEQFKVLLSICSLNKMVKKDMQLLDNSILLHSGLNPA